MENDLASVKISKLDILKSKDNALVLGFFKDKLELNGDVKKLDAQSASIISSYIASGNFKAEKSEIKSLFLGKNFKNIMLVGLGDESEFDLNALCGMIANASRKLRNAGSETFSICMDSFKEASREGDVAEKIVQGALAGLYQFTSYKTKDTDKIKHVKQITIITSSSDSFEGELKYSIAVSDAIFKTRDLVNTPPNIATPEYIANYAKGLAKKNGLKCTIFDEKQITEMKMGCLAAVANGSINKPKLLVMEYMGAGSKKGAIAIVGKGVTFDSGGLNLKPYPYILNMKDDMAGAACAVHILEACSKLKLPINLIAVAPLCENMIDASCYRPDDVLTAYNGMTVEIKNTDAEGRLILADALSYAAKLKPDAIIDIATLTGASMVVLGYAGTPFLSTDPKLSEKINIASKKSLEKVWELPLWQEYEDSIKSDVADIKNISEEGDAGVIIGATFLKNFTCEIPWAHIDIGTTVWSKTEKGMFTKGATGVTVRLLMELLRDWI